MELELDVWRGGRSPTVLGSPWGDADPGSLSQKEAIDMAQPRLQAGSHPAPTFSAQPWAKWQTSLQEAGQQRQVSPDLKEDVSRVQGQEWGHVTQRL
jgi:hypothetical protein